MSDERADPVALIDAAFAMGADHVSLHRNPEATRARQFAAHVSSTRVELDGGRYTSAHALVFGYGATWQDALVDAMVKVPAADRRVVELDEKPKRAAIAGERGSVNRAERRRLSWGRRG